MIDVFITSDTVLFVGKTSSRQCLFHLISVWKSCCVCSNELQTKHWFVIFPHYRVMTLQKHYICSIFPSFMGVVCFERKFWHSTMHHIDEIIRESYPKVFTMNSSATSFSLSAFSSFMQRILVFFPCLLHHYWKNSMFKQRLVYIHPSYLG